MQFTPFSHPAWIEVDLVKFKQNIFNIKKYIGHDVKLCLPIKANAYGHGLVEIARAASTCVDYLAVSCLQEGIMLRLANVNIPILVLGAIHIEQITDLIKYDLEFTISSKYKAQLVIDECIKLNSIANIHLEIDTGMNRTGIRVSSAYETIEFIHTHPCLKIKGIYSHLASADTAEDEFNLIQINKFINFVQQLNLKQNGNILFHLANSAGTIYFSQTHLDMVRPGLLAFGYYPSYSSSQNKNIDVVACMAIKAKISYFKTVLAGEGIGYNHTFKTTKNTRVITIPIGYGDGVRRSLSNKGDIILNGNKYPIVGNICMDQFMVDIGDGSAYVGDIVTIIGKQELNEITIYDHAKLANTNTYEILCGFNNRLPRYYITEDGGYWES